MHRSFVRLLGLALLAPWACCAEFSLELAFGWTLVSVPISLEQPEVASAFGPGFLGCVWSWDSEVRCYRQAEELQPGEGYWVYRHRVDTRGGREPVLQIPLHGAPPCVYAHRLHPGWNLVGAFGSEPFADLTMPPGKSVSRGIATRAWGWSREHYVPVQFLAAGRAAWIYADIGTDVRLSVYPGFGGVRKAYSPDRGQLCVEWDEAIDDATPADEITYYIYVAEAASETPLIADENLVTHRTGTTSATLYGGVPSQVYDVAAIAEDAQGFRNYCNHQAVAVKVSNSLTDFTVTPSMATGKAGDRQTFVFTATFADGSSYDVSEYVSVTTDPMWSIVVRDCEARVMAGAPAGAVTLTGQFGSAKAEAILTVVEPQAEAGDYTVIDLSGQFPTRCKLWRTGCSTSG